MRWWVLAALVLGACDDGDDDGGGGSDNGGALAGILGKAFDDQSPLSGGDPADETPQGGAGGAGGAGGGAAPRVADNCTAICDRIVNCMPRGCPNWLRIPAAERARSTAGCAEDMCADGDPGDEAAAQVEAASCAEIVDFLGDQHPGIAEFCALNGATDAECDQFCPAANACLEQARQPTLDAEQCKLWCVYGDGVRCVNEHVAQGCAALVTCREFFPAANDDEDTAEATESPDPPEREPPPP